MEYFPRSLLPSCPPASLPAEEDNRERGRGAALGPRGSPWHLEVHAAHSGGGGGSYAPVCLCPQLQVRVKSKGAPGEFPLANAAAAFWVTHRTCGQGSAREMSCLEQTHSASCSPADDGLPVSFATAQDGANSWWVSAKAEDFAFVQDSS